MTDEFQHYFQRQSEFSPFKTGFTLYSISARGGKVGKERPWIRLDSETVGFSYQDLSKAAGRFGSWGPRDPTPDSLVLRLSRGRMAALTAPFHKGMMET